jgi:DNA-binding MarR family transcriptional regulator
MSNNNSEDSIPRLIDKFWETIPPTWRRVRNNTRSIASEHFGITVEQFHILRHVRKGCKLMSELADILQISRPAISQAVEALVSKGLLSRTQDTQDRRYMRLELTPAGNDLLNAIFQKNRTWMAEKFSNLTPQEINLLLQALDIVQKSFE